MTGFSLLENFISNPQVLLRKNRSSATSSSATPPTDEPVTHIPSTTTAMAQKSLHEFSAPLLPTCPLGLLSISMTRILNFVLG
jgi:hypothetical protein